MSVLKPFWCPWCLQWWRPPEYNGKSAYEFFDELEVGYFRLGCTSKNVLRYGEDWNFTVQRSFLLTFTLVTLQCVSCIMVYYSPTEGVELEFQLAQTSSRQFDVSFGLGQNTSDRFIVRPDREAGPLQIKVQSCGGPNNCQAVSIRFGLVLLLVV